MIINNAINSPFPTTLAKGGTNAALTASNGGIFYSTASAGAILAGTATANQILLSGSSTTPAWSTATYPATTTINQLLYSSAANVISGLSTANSSSLVTNSSGVPAWSAMTNGQVIIGSTGGAPTSATLTAGIGGTRITNNPGGIKIDSGIPSWEWIDTQTALPSSSSSGNISLNFDNQLTSDYTAYRLVVHNILPQNGPTGSSDSELWLRFGTGSGTYVDAGDEYSFQQCSIGANGTNNSYFGAKASYNFASLTFTDGSSGISLEPSYGGVSGIIDLFVTPGSSQVANGISRLSYMADHSGVVEYVNVTSTFQIAADNYTSVQLLLNTGNPIISGSASLYGLNTLSDGSENFQWIATQSINGWLNFNQVFKSKYISYRLVINNILPESNGIDLWLRFGSPVASGFKYIFQQCGISNAGSSNFYHGYNGGRFDAAFITLTNVHGISPDPAYGGASGIIDLFVTSGSSQVANGIARFGYAPSDGIQQYINTTSTFQITADNYTSVQLFLERMDFMASGSATLYGLTTLE